LVSDKPGTLELRELSLALNTPDGMVVVVACSHPGIDKIVDAAATINPRIHLVAGGFHLVASKDEEIEKMVSGLLDTYKVAYVAPDTAPVNRPLRHSGRRSGFVTSMRDWVRRWRWMPCRDPLPALGQLSLLRWTRMISTTTARWARKAMTTRPRWWRKTRVETPAQPVEDRTGSADRIQPCTKYEALRSRSNTSKRIVESRRINTARFPTASAWSFESQPWIGALERSRAAVSRSATASPSGRP
jgi:hypothetical protein